MTGTDHLAANLAALDEIAPTLAGRIRLPVDGSHVARGADGRLVHRLGREWYPLELEAAQVEALIGPPGRFDPVAVVGVGAGELVAAALHATTGPVMAVERDPWLVRLLLRGQDLTRALRSRRLHIVMGADLLDLLERAPARRVVHPVQAGLLEPERYLLEHGAGGPFALLATGELFVEDLAAALRRAGLSVFPWAITQHSLEELEYTARRVRPVMAAAINQRPGLTETCHRLGVPLVIWEIDPSLDPPVPCTTPSGHTHVFTFRRATAPGFRSAGFEHVSYLPLAADPARRAPVTVTAGQATAVGFVGSSMVGQVPRFKEHFLRLWERWAPGRAEEGQALLRGVVEEQRGHSTRDLLPALIEAQAPGFREASPTDPALVAGEIAAAERRVNLVSRLGRFGVRVWGDDGWKLAEPAGAHHQGWAGHGPELTRIYGSTLINVDIGRLYQLDIVTMRVFDVVACGAFVLAERSEALAELFTEGEHLAAWSTPEELEEKVAWYLANPDSALRIGAQGRAHLIEHHTFDHRVKTMIHHAGITLPGTSTDKVPRTNFRTGA